MMDGEIDDGAGEEPQIPGYTKADLQKIASDWLEKIKSADKRMEKWRREAELAEAAYTADSDRPADVPQFNILHSNVETIVPAIYNSPGVPDIRSRHNDADEVSRQFATVLERAIATQIDDSRMDREIELVAQDAFLSGRGVIRLKFEANISEETSVDPNTAEETVVQSVWGERIQFENVSWRDYREGPAARWADVPWVAYRHMVTPSVIDDLEDKGLAETQDEGESEEPDEKADQAVWEIWCKEDGQVYLIIEDRNRVVKIVDDPLGLPGFFPQPEPVQPITRTGSRMPVCPYAIYRTLAEEMDTLTRRIRALSKVMKARGLTAGDGAALASIADLDDGEIGTAPNLENILALGGLDRAVLWWPIEKFVIVIRELTAQRDQTKQAIYEITGISDIVRGASAASETATAQQIKTQWGSLRIKKMQRMIERTVREVFNLTADLITSKFSIEGMQRASGVQMTPELAQFMGRPLDVYRIDVESNSTVRADATANRQEMAEFLQGTANFFATMAPIVQQAPQTAGQIVEMYSAFARQFNLGKSAEDALDNLVKMASQVAAQPQPNPQAEADKAANDLKMKELQLKFGELALKMKEFEQKGQLEVGKLALNAVESGLM